MSKLRITRSVTIPDSVRINRCKKAPELGPKVLFFSGGSALRELSSKLIKYTHNSIHLITPFDSGGSSAKIRETFNMLSVGDIRNRLMALADKSFQINTDIYNLFNYRFPHDENNRELRKRLISMAEAKDPIVLKIPNPIRRIIRNHIHFFLEKIPDDFDLKGASMGNLILSGGYLNNRRHIDPVIFLFSKMVEVRGVVIPITGKSYHLCATFKDGSIVVGQHLLTGKEAPNIKSKITNIHLTKDLKSHDPVEIKIKNKISSHITSADLICFPYGSFYTSLVANLLVKGVGDAICKAACPKIYIPNIMGDPEQYGMSLYESVKLLIHYLRQSCNEKSGIDSILDFVVVDTESRSIPNPSDLEKIRDLGIQIIKAPLGSRENDGKYNPDRIADLILSMI